MSAAPLEVDAVDRATVLAMLSAIGCTSMATAAVVLVEGEPRSKARVRFGNGRAYNSKLQKESEQLLGLHMRAVIAEPVPGNVSVACLFYRSSRQRIDLDNLLKQVLDSGNRICWNDDRQVTAIAGSVQLDRDRPRTLIAIGSHDSTLLRDPTRDVVCVRCGKVFRGKHLAPCQMFGKQGQYCSPGCVAKSKGEDFTAEANCLGCHKPFQRRRVGHKYCSEPCRIVALLKRHSQRRIHPESFCEKCGIKVSRPEYKMCRPCWRVSRKDANAEWAAKQ